MWADQKTERFHAVTHVAHHLVHLAERRKGVLGRPRSVGQALLGQVDADFSQRRCGRR